jgi:hypothetical protein
MYKKKPRSEATCVRPRVPITHRCCILFALLILSLIRWLCRRNEGITRLTFLLIQVLESSRALRSPLSLVGGLMPFPALECLSAIANLASIVRLVGCALLRGPEMKRRPWQVVICYASYLASLAMVDMVDSKYGSGGFYYFNWFKR